MTKTTNPNTEAEKAHQKALTLIYRHTHRDYKGNYGGVKSIMVCRGGASWKEKSRTKKQAAWLVFSWWPCRHSSWAVPSRSLPCGLARWQCVTR